MPLASLHVTGGADFICGNFVHFWIARHPDERAIVLDDLTYTGNRATLSGATNVQLIVSDIRNTVMVEDLLRASDIATIVHFAAESHVDRCNSGPDMFIDTNMRSTRKSREKS